MVVDPYGHVVTVGGQDVIVEVMVLEVVIMVDPGGGGGAVRVVQLGASTGVSARHSQTALVWSRTGSAFKTPPQASATAGVAAEMRAS